MFLKEEKNIKHDKSHFDFKKWGDDFYPVVKRKKGEAKIDECPFCGAQHTHSSGDGYRTAHCSDRNGYLKEVEIKGKVFYQSKGYFISEY